MTRLIPISPYKAQQQRCGIKVEMIMLLVIAIVLVPISVQATEPSSGEGLAQVSEQVLEEVPEEVLRSEILLDGRSPLTGQPLNATEYAEMQSDLETANAVTPQVAPKLRNLVGLIQLRKFIKTVLPIVPIK